MFSMLQSKQTLQFLTRPVSFVMATIVLTTSLLLVGCSSEDAPSAPVPTAQHAPQPAPQPVENKVAVVTPPVEPKSQAAPTQPAAEPVVEPISDDRLEQSTPPPQEPRADEIARTIELETELSEIVQTASAMLDPDQAQALLSRADRWSQNGFDCPDGAGREACRQYNIRNLIKEIDNKMRGIKTEY